MVFSRANVFAVFTLFMVPSRANMSSLFMLFSFSSERACAVYDTFTSEYVCFFFCFFFSQADVFTLGYM